MTPPSAGGPARVGGAASFATPSASSWRDDHLETKHDRRIAGVFGSEWKPPAIAFGLGKNLVNERGRVRRATEGLLGYRVVEMAR